MPGDFDAQLISSRVLAQESIYPAVDTRRTSSNLMKSEAITEDHRILAARIKKGLDETIENLYQGAVNDANWFFNTDPDGRSWVQLLCFLSQSYFVGEPYTGLKAAFISPFQSLEAMESILAGDLVNVPAHHFRFKNSLNEIVPSLA